MSIINHFSLKNNSEIGLWEITETLQELERLVELCDEEVNKYNVIKVEQRKKQWLVSRILLKKMLNKPATIHYHNTGKPYIIEENFNISISHSDNMVAVYISPYNHIGIDIESIDKRIINITHKFLTNSEFSYANSLNVNQLHAIWGAKESIFKAYGNTTTFFNKNIDVKPFLSNENGHMTADVLLEDDTVKQKLNYQIIGKYMLVYTSN